MKLLPTIVVTALLLLVAIPATAQMTAMDEAMAQSPDQLIADIESQHPAIYYLLAMKLFEAERKEESVFWFYAGQLRFRFHLESHPELDPSGDKALFASLSQSVGNPLNAWAFGDLALVESSLAKVMAWDEKTNNAFTSKTQYAEQWQSTREGMLAFAKYLRENGESIREQRKASGLENRN